MKKTVSCCGVICEECAYYSKDCKGCAEIHGKAFWLEFTGESICSIYECCVMNKRLPHCGNCPQLPCRRYDQEDPTKTPEENAEDLRKQMKLLRQMR